MFDMNPDEFPPRKEWEDVLRYWKHNILPECLEKANEEGLGPLRLRGKGTVEHRDLGINCLQVALCLGLITFRFFAEAEYFGEYFEQFMEEIFLPFMEKHEH